MKILFAGTPEFARQSLAALFDAGFAPAAVYTQPDRPAGRGKRMSSSPVKRFAEEHDLEIAQPRSLRDDAVVAALAAHEPDVLIVAAYGLILPQAVLDIPRCGCINVHASLLPRWRGAAPIQAAILAGDAETGISIMQMEAGLDSGPVYATRTLCIGADETAGELHDRLAALGGELLVECLPAIVAGKRHAVAQDAASVTYAGKFRSEDAALDWQGSAEHEARRVRAYNPVPGAWFTHGGERIKCWRAAALPGADAPAGTVLAAGEDGIDVACADGMLRLLSLQRPGRKTVSAAEFASQLPLAGAALR